MNALHSQCSTCPVCVLLLSSFCNWEDTATNERPPEGVSLNTEYFGSPVRISETRALYAPIHLIHTCSSNSIHHSTASNLSRDPYECILSSVEWKRFRPRKTVWMTTVGVHPIWVWTPKSRSLHFTPSIQHAYSPSNLYLLSSTRKTLPRMSV